MGWESCDAVRFDLGPLRQCQMRTAKLKSAYNAHIMQYFYLFIISRRHLAREGDDKMHHVCVYVHVWLYALVCYADFSTTSTARDFL